MGLAIFYIWFDGDVEFERGGEGIHIQLTQIKFLNEEMRDNHNSRWAGILACSVFVFSMGGYVKKSSYAMIICQGIF